MNGSAAHAETIAFLCNVLSPKFRDFAKSVLALMDECGFDPVSSLWANERNFDGPQGMEAALMELTADSGEQDELASWMHVVTESNVNADLRTFPPASGQPAFCTLEVRFIVRFETALSECIEFQQRCADLSSRLLATFAVHSLQLVPREGGCHCLPDVPLVDGCSHLVVATEQEVSEFYSEPAAFWNAGWAVAGKRDDQRLLARAMDLVAGPDFLACIIDGQWSMARGAKPGETGYGDPIVLPEAAPVFNAGPARLEFVGYSAADELIEYSCVLSEGQHIQGWEVFALRDIVKTKRTPDGKAPVEVVRVVFLEEWMARSEKRPLLDVGCKVFYYAADGELAEILE